MEWRTWLTACATALACWITFQQTARTMITQAQTQFLQQAVNQISASLRKKFGGQLTIQQCEDLAKTSLITVADAVYKAGSGSGKHDRANRNMIIAADQVANQQGAACKSGCSHCCKSEKISITGYEARTIKDNFGSLSEPIRQAVLNNIRSYKSTGTPDEREKSPCVFLVEEKCSIHKFRPSLCWSYLSKSEAMCAARLKNGGGPTLVLETAVALYMAFQIFYPFSTTDDEELRGGVFEMNAAMKYLLVDGGAVEDLAPGSAARKVKQIPLSLL